MHSFQPDCTLPAEQTAFISSPNVRGTLDILWSCLSIILLCTWSVIRQKIPPQIEPQSFWQRCRYTCYFLWLKLRLMALALLAPELLLGFAWFGFVSVRRNKLAMQDFARDDDVPWSLQHAYLAEMGGFVIDFTHLQSAGTPKINSGDAYTRTLTFFKLQPKRDAEIGSSRAKEEREALDEILSLAALASNWSKAPWKCGNVNWHIDQENSLIVQEAIGKATENSTPYFTMDDYMQYTFLQGNIWYVSADQLYEARSCGIIRNLPNLSEKVLEDKDKGDSLLTVLACFQICWLALQLLIRACNGVSSTPLEIVTLAFAGCSFFTYALNYRMPQDVKAPVYVRAERHPTKDEIRALAQKRPKRLSSSHRITLADAKAPFYLHGQDRTPWFSIDSSITASVPGYHIVFGVPLGGAFLGGLHCLAWNSHFPTMVERLLWRVASPLTAALPIAFLILETFSIYLNPFVGEIWDYVVSIAFIFLYALCRIYILIESFRSLAFQPVDAFTTTWTGSLPHIG